MKPKGYGYVIFESERQVKSLLTACDFRIQRGTGTEVFFFKISSKRIKAKNVW